MIPPDGRSRVVVEHVYPQVDDGDFAVKRIEGDTLTVEADILADGHDSVAGEVLYRHAQDEDWRRLPMMPRGNDRWRCEIPLSGIGRYRYTVEGWIDRFASWRSDLAKRIDAGQVARVEYLIGAELIDEAAARAANAGADAAQLREWAAALRGPDSEMRGEIALADELAAMMERYPDRRFASRCSKELPLVVDREKASFSAWYEVFPRSCSPDASRPGTLRECEARLPYIAGMGFDTLYFPPIHPIGQTARKGRNNGTAAAPDDPGSPWAIGSAEGGHTAIDPQLGTLDDFQRLVAKAAELHIEIALDIAFQCSPDHPYVRQHPEWFRKRPDGTIQCAQNPPKKYEDIFPFDFETTQWRELWEELKNVLMFWIAHGVRIFRVDNPHTKALPFWEWAISEIKARHPEVIFLAEAFTRPKVMYRLAKCGFSQSYTYFTWRNTKQELTDYFRQLTETELREFFRPNLWPNTPDILPEYLQVGGRAAFAVRLILAATLGANYGIYGPAFELCENSPREPGGEEYLDSEKYEVKHWHWDDPRSLKGLIARVNRIRRESPSLHRDVNLRFHETDNPSVICYSKSSPGFTDTVIVLCNLDAFHMQSGWVNLDLAALGLDDKRAFQAHDLLAGTRYLWHGARNYFELVPETRPAHIMKVRRFVRTERDFDYYL
ncbi:MAG TPA: alpha-1,4-glucan--maltose-1-phosphate maltosyltransferase [Bryobacteraceae bacterium]|nr:alpha-1,4-glucan--maltose-1-phosphate maltosyltransferase [Bryobacteraceae bacterium]